MKVAIVGYDREGKVSYEYFKNQGADITICDQVADLDVPPEASSQLGPEYLSNLDRFDIIVRTPGLHPAKILQQNPDVGPKITSQINLFFAHSPTKNIIGITGTKGKGTTSTLVTRILQGAGKDVHLAGNIGIPALTLLDSLTPDSWVVLELSNFQLIDLRQSPHIACVLMTVPEHLDWHEDLEEYIAAKQQLFIHQANDDIAIYYSKNENSVSIADASEGIQIPFFEAPGAIVRDGEIFIEEQAICAVSDLKLIGEHNWQNACAAVTIAWQITQDHTAIRAALTSFSGLPYRIEHRRTVDEVAYYNDSFATGPGSAIAAIQAIHAPKVLLLGGYDRGLELTELIEAIQQHAAGIRHIVLIGSSADRLASELNAASFSNYSHCRDSNMPAIIAAAQAHAKPGDAIVLSPAFASFDMFKNFEARGDAFNEAVEAL